MNNSMTLRSDSSPWYKERWPWILMAGPAIVIVAGIATLWLAVASNDGLVTDDYYKQGLAINQRLQRDHHAVDIGLAADIMRSGVMVRLLLTSEGEFKAPEKVTLKMMHPTRAGFDQVVELVSEGGGFYSGQLREDVGGRWNISIEDADGSWRLQGEWKAGDDNHLKVTARPSK